MALNHRMTLARFVQQRLGNEQDTAALLKTMLILSFGAGSFREFWRYWNPVYGYFLYRYCYRPLRNWLPRPVCVLATFAASGFFLHDLPFGWWVRALRGPSLPLPFVAVWFTLIGLFVLLTDVLHVNWGNRPLMARALFNGGCIVLAFFLAFYLQTLL